MGSYLHISILQADTLPWVRHLNIRTCSSCTENGENIFELLLLRRI